MIKVKIGLTLAAVLIAICGAVGSRPDDFCEYQTQYFKYGNQFFPAGNYGSDYTCVGSAGVCTWYKTNPIDPNSFAPCRTGQFQLIY